MNEHVSGIVQNVQQAASSKSAILVGLTGASVELWIEKLVTDSLFQNSMILIGAMVPITIIMINLGKVVFDYKTKDERKVIEEQKAIQAKEETRQAKLRTLLLEVQVKEKGLSVD
jgi:uncharacterized protein YacL